MKRKRKPKSLFRRIIFPMMLVLIMQAILLNALLQTGGVFHRIHQNSMDMLSDRTRNKYQILQNSMVSWSSLQDTADIIDAKVLQRLTQEKKSFEDIRTDAALNAKIVEDVADDLILRLRQDSTSGVFLVLNGEGVSGNAETYAGMYIRDTTPESHVQDNSDLQILRGLPPLTRKLGLALDTHWQASFHLHENNEGNASDFFFKPLRAAQSGNSRTANHYFSYWSERFNLNNGDGFPIFTFSMPLRGPEETVYGILGVEMSIQHVSSLLTEENHRQDVQIGGYFLGVSSDGGQTYRNVLTTGNLFNQFFSEGEPLQTTAIPAEGFIVARSTKAEEDVYGATLPLQTYNRNTVFFDNQWTLIGLQDQKTLFAFERQTFLLTMSVVAIMVVIGTGISIFTAQRLAKPITGLIHQLRSSDPSEELQLQHTGIAEVDVLVDSVTTLHYSAGEEARKISKIIEMTGLSIGVFELLEGSDQAFCSDGFFSLLGIEQTTGNRISKERCLRLMEQYLSNPVPGFVDVFEIRDPVQTRYLGRRTFQDGYTLLGTLMDVSEEVKSRRQIEHERDFDLLTDIYNRRAFEDIAGSLFKNKKRDDLKTAALMMLDLDNLKAINDSYGHDCGDQYIRAFANALHHFQSNRSIIARRSGDEFYILFYGFSNRAELRSLARNGWAKVIEETIRMPDGAIYKLRASGGLAWYPDDSEDFFQLMHYADFAMYKSKTTIKGTLEEFSKDEYHEDGYLFNGMDALNRLLEDEMVRYVLQPIISAKTGKVYGYEMLMRSLVPELPTPDTILKIAKQQGKLCVIEQITWLKALATVRGLQSRGLLDPQMKIFINSIGDQIISQEDIQQIESQYSDILPNMVLEIPDNENHDTHYTQEKATFMHNHRAEIAIDNYGIGYHSEVALTDINAEYIKLDMSFVHDVDSDVNKREVLREMIRYAKQHNIRVLAVGVETPGEMATLIRMGVDYLQGYYICRPNAQICDSPDHIKAEVIKIASEA